MTLGEANSRMKDYFDLAQLAAQERFKGEVLQIAIRGHRSRRNGRSFMRNRRQAGLELHDAIVAARSLLMPVCEAESKGERFDAEWEPSGPWRK